MSRYLVFALLLFAGNTAAAAEKTVARTFAVTPGGMLKVDADSASVKVSATETNQVAVRLYIRGAEDDLAEAKLDASQNSDGVNVTMRLRAKGSWFRWQSWNNEARIEVTVPKRYRIDVHTTGGGIELKDTIGTAALHTSGGSIVARNVSGNLLARTSGGGILAENIRGDVDVDTSGGSIRLMQIDGKIRGETSGGSVQCSLVGINRGISATTSGGGIQVTVPRGTTANIEATTSGGRFTTNLPMTAMDRQDNHVQGSINGGGALIDVHTSGGGISVNAGS